MRRTVARFNSGNRSSVLSRFHRPMSRGVFW